MNIPEKADINQALLAFLKTTIVEKDVEILAQTPFRQLGVDSLSIIELVLFIERRFQVVIPEDELTPENLNSVESLTACTVRHLPK
ncbi:MAG: acyl carrier protein [Cyclobacteriaceae bacterium]|jgi:acyl carrier protein|nr:acyl carrier protein [Cyclobacteriaceae bacterium]MDH4296675.1 acyl carrier protein [Cyclobacteriaceae bacterium]MDH5248085.1 acyl carrier protein [Cyclobacteriaceae bacterium]